MNTDNRQQRRARYRKTGKEWRVIRNDEPAPVEVYSQEPSPQLYRSVPATLVFLSVLAFVLCFFLGRCINGL